MAKQVVEGPDRAGEKCRAAPNQVTLDPVDVDPIRDDEPGIAFEHVEIAPQEQRDLADVRRPHDERETHRSIVVLAPGALSYALRKERSFVRRPESASTQIPVAKILKASASRPH